MSAQPRLEKAECMNQPSLLLYSDDGQRNPSHLDILKSSVKVETSSSMQGAIIATTAKITRGPYKTTLGEKDFVPHFGTGITECDAACCYLMPAFPENSVRKSKLDSVLLHST